jgi:DNA helicase-2/ATP-dependent DNA helicase PcrA
MSVTALQNFLNITSGGPDGFVANSLLRFPSAKNASASYGSAIHAALEKFFQNYMTNQVFDKDILHSTFYEYIHREGFSPIHTRDMLEK